MIPVRLRCIILFFSIVYSLQSVAQDALPIPRDIEQAYQSGTRSLDGKPGKNYWQNGADYDIRVNFNPATLFVKGAETIDYVNNSADTLTDIYFKLYPNLFKKGAQRLAEVLPDDVTDGMQIEGISVTNSPVITYALDGTNMRVSIPPVYPKQHIVFNVSFHYTLNKGANLRTGQIEENAAVVAYFFPRIAVYDDLEGWNRNQYMGTQEFYNDFCNFRAAITVPKDFVVWATGSLTNCSEVLNSKYCNLIKQAEANDSVTNIVDSTDIESGNITADDPYNTWLFTANNVTDFAFATSNHYLWQSSSVLVDSATGRRTRVDAAFNPKHRDYFDVIHYNRATVAAMSFTFPKWPFPFPHETIFDGLDQMEFPMMVNDNPTATKFDAITLTDHEIFHSMFPFYMGINETKYGWMDEGWATIGEWIISPLIDSTLVDNYGMLAYETAAGKESDLPVTTLTTQLNGSPFFLNSYVKPGLGYLYVKDYLGDELFTKALHFYIQQWHGKHPMPYDFFNCINTGSGKNLNWFWKRWFFDSGAPDLAITALKKRGRKYSVTVTEKGSKPVPVDLFITLDDGSILKEHQSIGIWENENNKNCIVSFKTDKGVKKITLGSTYIPDINKADNVWMAK